MLDERSVLGGGQVKSPFSQNSEYAIFIPSLLLKRAWQGYGMKKVHPNTR
jgi:hypothetical protein